MSAGTTKENVPVANHVLLSSNEHLVHLFDFLEKSDKFPSFLLKSFNKETQETPITQSNIY